jgi:hypothetical protein
MDERAFEDSHIICIEDQVEFRIILKLLMVSAIACMGPVCPVHAQEKAPTTTVPVRMTVTLRLLGENSACPK